MTRSGIGRSLVRLGERDVPSGGRSEHQLYSQQRITARTHDICDDLGTKPLAFYVAYWPEGAVMAKQTPSAPPPKSDVDLFRYREGVIDLDADGFAPTIFPLFHGVRFETDG